MDVWREVGILKHLVVFSADLHGSEVQYRKLVDFAVSERADSLIIGGDIAPLIRHKYLMYEQRVFISERLPKLLSPLKTSDCQALHNHYRLEVIPSQVG